MSVDFGGGDVRTCQDQVTPFPGARRLDLRRQHRRDPRRRATPSRCGRPDGPATGVHTAGTLTIAPYARPGAGHRRAGAQLPPHDARSSSSSAAPTTSAHSTCGAGGFITVTVDGPDGHRPSYCDVRRYYDYTDDVVVDLRDLSRSTRHELRDRRRDRGRRRAWPVVSAERHLRGRPREQRSRSPSPRPSDGSSFTAGSPIPFGGTGAVLSMPTLEIARVSGRARSPPWCYGNVIGPPGCWNCPGGTTLSRRRVGGAGDRDRRQRHRRRPRRRSGSPRPLAVVPPPLRPPPPTPAPPDPRTVDLELQLRRRRRLPPGRPGVVPRQRRARRAARSSFELHSTVRRARHHDRGRGRHLHLHGDDPRRRRSPVRTTSC